MGFMGSKVLTPECSTLFTKQHGPNHFPSTWRMGRITCLSVMTPCPQAVETALPPHTCPLPQGGVLGIKIGWVCDLDRAWDQCIPKYSFTRLDSVSEKSSVSPGYNFR